MTEDDQNATPFVCRVATSADDAIRALVHATLPSTGFPGLANPTEVYEVLAALQALTARLPQLMIQLSAYLQRALQFDLVSVDDGVFADDPLGAVGTAGHHLERRAPTLARSLAEQLGSAHEAIAYISFHNPDQTET